MGGQKTDEMAASYAIFEVHNFDQKPKASSASAVTSNARWELDPVPGRIAVAAS